MDIAFIQIEDKRQRYIIYTHTEDLSDKRLLELILERFYSDNFRSFFDKKCPVWSDYTDKCIAYRDGKCSRYTIWQYKY